MAPFDLHVAPSCVQFSLLSYLYPLISHFSVLLSSLFCPLSSPPLLRLSSFPPLLLSSSPPLLSSSPPLLLFSSPPLLLSSSPALLLFPLICLLSSLLSLFKCVHDMTSNACQALVLGMNPSAFTLQGTNTYLVARPLYQHVFRLNSNRQSLNVARCVPVYRTHSPQPPPWPAHSFPCNHRKLFFHV